MKDIFWSSFTMKKENLNKRFKCCGAMHRFKHLLPWYGDWIKIIFEMIVQFTGERGGKLFTDDRGHNYCVQRTKNGRIYLLCVYYPMRRRKLRKNMLVCGGRGNFRDGDTEITISCQHTCHPEPLLQQVFEAKRDMLQYAKEHPNLTAMDTYTTVARRYSSEVLSKINFASFRKSINNYKVLDLPHLPKTSQELAVILQRLTLTDKSLEEGGRPGLGRTLDGGAPPFFQERQEGAWGENFIFYSDYAVTHLLESGHPRLHVDATFKVVPRVLNFKQLFIIYSVVNDYAIPTVYVLMTRKTQLAYEAIFNHLKEKLPSMAPVLVISDFEKAIQNAIKVCFPSAKVKGCWFHYEENVVKEAQSLGLTALLRNDIFNRYFSMMLVIPLLPAGELHNALDDIEKDLKECSLRNPELELMKLQPIIDYIRKVWLQGVGADILSVWMEVRRTNNNAESFHALLLRFIRSRPGLWEFLEKLQELNHVFSGKLRSIVNGDLGVRIQKMEYACQNSRIINASKAFEANKVSRLEFLKSVMYITKNLVTKAITAPEEEFELAEADNEETIGRVDPPYGPFLEEAYDPPLRRKTFKKKNRKSTAPPAATPNDNTAVESITSSSGMATTAAASIASSSGMGTSQDIISPPGTATLTVIRTAGKRVNITPKQTATQSRNNSRIAPKRAFNAIETATHTATPTASRIITIAPRQTAVSSGTGFQIATKRMDMIRSSHTITLHGMSPRVVPKKVILSLEPPSNKVRIVSTPSGNTVSGNECDSDTLTATEGSETESVPNERNEIVPGAGENIQPDQQQSASSYFAYFNPEEDSDEVVPHVDESRLVPPQSSANSRDELLNLMYEEAQEAGPFLANGSAENFPSDVPPHIDESLLSPLQSSVPDDPDELINMMYEGAIQFLTDDSGENFLGDVLPKIDESQLMPPQCSAVQCSAVQSSPVDQDELVKPDKETQQAKPAKDSEEPPAVELQDGSETETASKSGGEEEINYLELEPSAFDMEKVPYLGKFLTADEMRAGLAALKRQKEIMRAINEIEHKQTRTIFDDHMIPLEEYPGYCDLQAEYQAIQSRLTLDKPEENVPDDYFENFMSLAKSNRKRKFKSKRRSNCKRRR